MAKQYDYSKAAKMTDLFSEEFLERLDLKTHQITSVKFKRGKRVKLMFVRNVFTTFLILMLTECIEHNIKFLAPGRFWFYIWIKKITPGNFNRIVKNGIYKSVDMIDSDFNIYEFVFKSVYLPRFHQERRIRISYDRYQDLIQKVNKGKRYHE